MAMERPVAGIVSGEVKRHLASWQYIYCVLQRVVPRIAVNNFKEVAMKMDRVLHHRVIDQGHSDTLIASEADWLDDLAEFLSVE